MWYYGKKYNITWSATSDINTLYFYLCQANYQTGITYCPLNPFLAAPNAPGYYTWTIPNVCLLVMISTFLYIVSGLYGGSVLRSRSLKPKQPEPCDQHWFLRCQRTLLHWLFVSILIFKI